MTSAGESLQATLNEYLSEVPADKVIAAPAAVRPRVADDRRHLAGEADGAPRRDHRGRCGCERARGLLGHGHPDGWTPFRVGKQWHEVFFETPRSLRLASRTAEANGIAGVGVWGLGTDGANDADHCLGSHAECPRDRRSASPNVSSVLDDNHHDTSVNHHTSSSTTTEPRTTTTTSPPRAGRVSPIRRALFRTHSPA